MSLRLSCSGAATARPAAPRACASCTVRSVHLYATVIALLLSPVRHWWLHMGPAGPAGLDAAARQLGQDTVLDAYKPVLLCSPVQGVTGSTFMPYDTSVLRDSILWDGCNVTAAAGQFHGIADTVCSKTTASTPDFWGRTSSSWSLESCGHDFGESSSTSTPWRRCQIGWKYTVVSTLLNIPKAQGFRGLLLQIQQFLG